MDDQFNDLRKPKRNELYYYCDKQKSGGFTYLMKLVLVVNKFPQAISEIKYEIANKTGTINKKNEAGWTALMFACAYCSSYSSIQCVKMLIDAGAIIDFASKYSNDSPLKLACMYCSTSSSLECVQLLIKSNATIDLIPKSKFNHDPDDIFKTACYRCTTTGSIQCVQLLLEHYSKYSYDDAIYYIISKIEYSENAKYKYNEYEIDESEIDCINILTKSSSSKCLSRIVHILNLNFYYSTPICKYIKLLIENGADAKQGSLLHIICHDNQHSSNDTNNCIKILVKSGADINEKNSYGYTPLMVVLNKIRILNDSVDLVKTLIDVGADVNCTSSKQDNTELISHQTALMILWKNRHDASKNIISITNILIDNGTDIDIQDEQGSTALMYFCENAKFNICYKLVDILKLMIEKSTNIMCTNSKGNTAYDYFVKNRYNNFFENEKIRHMLMNGQRFMLTKSANKVIDCDFADKS